MGLEITLHDCQYGVGIDERTEQKVLGFKDRVSGIEVVVPLSDDARKSLGEMLLGSVDVPTLGEMEQMVKNVKLRAPAAVASGRVG